MDSPKIPQIKLENNSSQKPSGLSRRIVVQEKPSAVRFSGKLVYKKPVFAVLGILIILFLLIVIPGISIYANSRSFYSSAKKLSNVGKSQDFSQIEKELKNTKKSLNNLRTSFKFLGWTKIIPFLGAYVKDTDHALYGGSLSLDAAEMILKTLEPYADIIGFSKSETERNSGGGEKTTQERIEFVMKAIPGIVPKMDEISRKLTLAKKEIDSIDPDRYPEEFKKFPVREKVKKGIDLFDLASDFIIRGKPLLEVTPYLMGVDSERTYLVLFQNDKELRPTGGFMTAYSIMKVNKGKFNPVISSDIYGLDGKYKPTIVAPQPLVKYLKGPYLTNKNIRLRDMNWSPDFYESMKQFTSEAEKVGITDIDGIIAVDTQLLVNLLNVIGRIGVPGFGNFDTQIDPECKCPQVIHELEAFADVEGPIVWDPDGSGRIIYRPPNSENRKKIIGPLMNSILANAMGQPKDKLPKLLEAGFKSLTEKHVLFYLKDEKAQKGVESFQIAGRIEKADQDYLHINDSNLGGRKSNLYVKEEVGQEISIAKDGTLEKTLTITYKNSEKHDGWLNSVLPNWVRVYVPKGSKLISVEGLEEKEDPYEEFDKTVFAGYFKLRPEGVAKVIFKYKIPIKKKGDLKLFIQKQPGKDAPLYIIKTQRLEQEFFLRSDQELSLKI